MITRRLFAVTATVLLTATVVHVGPAAASDGATAHRLAVTPTSLHRTVTHQVQDLPQHSIGVTGAASATATTGSGRSPLLLPSAPAVPWRLAAHDGRQGADHHDDATGYAPDAGAAPGCDRPPVHVLHRGGWVGLPGVADHGVHDRRSPHRDHQRRGPSWGRVGPQLLLRRS